MYLHSKAWPTVYELFCNGTRLLEQGDFHAAAVPLSRARELEPDKDSIREALGRALFGAQRYEEAAAEFGAIVEHRPTDDYAQFCLGRSLQQLGRHAEARGPLTLGGEPAAPSAPTTSATWIRAASRRLRRMVAAVLAAAALATPPASCASARTVVLDGPLRIVGTRVPTQHKRDRVGLYACLRGGRPTAIGQSGYPGFSGATDVDVVTFDGARYLATITVRDSGTGARYRVFDLRRHRQVTLARSAAIGFGEDPFRVLPTGTLARSDFGVQLIPRGFRGDEASLTKLGSTRSYDLAYVGSTLYWSTSANSFSPVVAAATTVDAPAAAPENRVYDITHLGPYNLTRHPGRCEDLPGRLVAASVDVRVVAHRGARRVCSIGGKRVAPAGVERRAADRRRRVAPEPRCRRREADRYVDRQGRGARARAGAQPPSPRTAARPGSTTAAASSSPDRAEGPGVLAPAGDAPSALAASQETIYWTSAGAPRRWQR